MGDWNGDAAVTGGLTIVGSFLYPAGIYENYPQWYANNEGHYYAECSNQGYCNRNTGLCECFPLREGISCDRTVCPNNCSGRGKCLSIREFGLISGQSYSLWDKDITYGCVCDAGFYEADCSRRTCPYGADVMYSTYDRGSIMIEIGT
jgi:hypothetical protein